jgi:hypothetical protein
VIDGSAQVQVRIRCPECQGAGCECGEGWLLQWVPLDDLVQHLEGLRVEQAMIRTMENLRAMPGVARGVAAGGQ